MDESYYSQAVLNSFINPACFAVSRCFAAYGLFVRIASNPNGSLLTFGLEQTSSSDVCHEIMSLEQQVRGWMKVTIHRPS